MKNSIRSFLWILSAAALLMLLPCGAVRTQAASPAKGIDVSQWQGAVNWQAVKNSGVKYAMIRIGNTKYGLDTQFAANMAGANAAGLKVGCYVYTYATTVQEAVADATLAVQAMASFTVSYPVAIDMEDECHKKLTPQQQADIVNAFCAVIYNAGYSPMVYSSSNWFKTRMGNVLWDHWVAQYNTGCDYPYFTMWQYTSSGSVSGISGRVDMNYLYKDYDTLIPANGFTEQAGNTYYFVNYRKQFGLQTIGGLQFLFMADGSMVKDMTVTDEGGNIIRYCKDGHIVVITAEMQQAAAAAAAAYQNAAAQTAAATLQAQTAQEQYEALTAQAAAIAQQAAEMAQAALLTAAQAAQTPTEELLAQATLTQQQSDLLQLQAAQAAEAMQTAQQNALTMAAALVQAQTAEAAAEQQNQLMQAAIVIPE